LFNENSAGYRNLRQISYQIAGQQVQIVAENFSSFEVVTLALVDAAIPGNSRTTPALQGRPARCRVPDWHGCAGWPSIFTTGL